MFDPEGRVIALPLEPALRIEAARNSIEAFGLATTEINVAVPGLENPEGRVVSLQSRPGGYLESSRLVLDESGLASTRIRSESTGKLTIRANMAGIAPATTEIQVSFPHLTLAAAIFGGLIGALVRVFGSQQTAREGFRWRSFIASMLSGIMIFALYAVGVNILPVAPTVTVGATLVFAVSALGAFLGIAGLDALGRASGGESDPGLAEEEH
ncbi:hypothetical protein [uncultured Erythrobacter sp.]|uniref:hypothetical protein n=1 Tax=uncultured Erythrobacter sp. TaxID=263913 RepID=UPI00263A0232|nr:hypothetical protein [uncultured Erythrobacter sp.]